MLELACFELRKDLKLNSEFQFYWEHTKCYIMFKSMIDLWTQVSTYKISKYLNIFRIIPIYKHQIPYRNFDFPKIIFKGF